MLVAGLSALTMSGAQLFGKPVLAAKPEVKKEEGAV
jgi:hypothetical protein